MSVTRGLNVAKIDESVNASAKIMLVRTKGIQYHRKDCPIAVLVLTNKEYHTITPHKLNVPPGKNP